MADVDTAPAILNSNLPAWIAVTVKSARERKDIVVQDNKTVEQFKVLVAKELNVAKEQLCLVFHSSTLDDLRTLRQCGIGEGSVLRAVVKKLTEPQAEKKAEVITSPFGLDAIGGLAGLVDMGFGLSNFADVQLRVQKKLHSDPALLRSLLENPIIKDIMSQPDLYTQMVASNPFLAELIQENPDMVEVMGNPTLMKQMMSLVTKPSVAKELIDDPKYKEFIAPKEEKDDEPNVKKQKLEEELEEDKVDLPKESKGNGTEGLLRQMIERPKEMASMLQAPYVQSAINFAATNPEYLRMMMNHIPGANDSEALKKQLDLALPYFAQQLANPEVHSLMCNPRALQAMLDVQEGMRELQQEIPGYFGYSKSDASEVKESDVLNQVLSSVTSHVSDLPDEDKYATQLCHLNHMGFTDREENLRVLGLAGGDINTAIIHYLQQQQNQQSEDFQHGNPEGYDLQQQVDPGLTEADHLQQVGESLGDQLLLPSTEGHQQGHLDGATDADDGAVGQSNVERLLLLEGEGSDVEASFALGASIKSER